MNRDMYFTEVKRLENIAIANRMRERELSEQQVFEASWCCVAILFCTLIVGYFS